MRKFGFDNECGTTFEYGISFLKFPEFKYGTEVIDTISIPGRAGTLTVRTGRYTDTTIKNEIEFQSNSLSEFEDKLWAIKEWVMKTKTVTYSDKEDKFFIVKKVEIDKEVRQYGIYGQLTITFTCDPAMYLVSGKNKMVMPGILDNPFSVAQPIYIIEGSGNCELEVNGKQMRMEVDGNIIIDVPRMIAYKNDKILYNTAVNGDYNDLCLQKGRNILVITEGFKCNIVPNWRCLE